MAVLLSSLLLIDTVSVQFNFDFSLNIFTYSNRILLVGIEPALVTSMTSIFKVNIRLLGYSTTYCAMKVLYCITHACIRYVKTFRNAGLNHVVLSIPLPKFHFT